MTSCQAIFLTPAPGRTLGSSLAIGVAVFGVSGRRRRLIRDTGGEAAGERGE